MSGFIQGLGIGFIFVPLSTAAFATLAPHLRNEGTPIFSLMRNIGGSVGISVVTMLLRRACGHGPFAPGREPRRRQPASGSLPQVCRSLDFSGLAALNAEVTRQAALIAYVNDFWIMMAMTLLSIPLLLLIRRPARGATLGSAMEAAH